MTVLVGGTFDPLHAGHLAYLRAAGTFGSLVCALSDKPDRPALVPIVERAELLRALGAEVVVVPYGEIVPLIEQYRPTAYVKGPDWQGRLPKDQLDTCKRHGTRIIYTDTARQSSSALLADWQRKQNAAKLADFEQFVQGQQPAAKAWEPVTDYSFEARKAIEGPHAELIRDVFCPVRALDVGCGPGHLVKMLRGLGVQTIGLDVTAEHASASYDGPFDDAVMKTDITAYAQFCCAADLVICREVLEHLTVRQVAIAVRNLVKLSSRYIYITTRFTAKPHLLDVDGSDDLDPTHITMLNQDFLRTLFVLEGCTRRADLEQRMDHQRKGRVLVYEVPR